MYKIPEDLVNMGGMTRFTGGVSINKTSKYAGQYLRIKTGPQRDCYVHELVALAKYGRPPHPDETIERVDTDTFNNHPDNIIYMSRSENCAAGAARQRHVSPGFSRLLKNPLARLMAEATSFDTDSFN